MLLSRDVRIVNKLASLCKEHRVPLRSMHVAAVVNNNTIISLGTNQKKTSPGMYRLSKTQDSLYIHAEYDALKDVRPGTGGRYTLYVVRIDKNGRYATSRPCSVCQRAIELAGIKRVVYTVNRGIVEEYY